MTLLNVLNISASALEAQSKKINVSACNLANSETMIYKNGKTTPYIAKKLIFKLQKTKNSQIGGVVSDKIINVKNPFKIIYDPSHPLANSKGYVKMPNVNPIDETINSITAVRNYQANIEILNTVKNLIMKIISIGQQ